MGRLLLINYSFASKKKLGLAVSRHYGNSVKRNRFKRQVREAFRHCAHQLPDGIEIVVRPRSMAKQASSCEIAKELLSLLHDCAYSRT